MAAWLVTFTCALVAAPSASAAVIGFDEQPASTVLGEQYAAAGVHLGPSPFAGQAGAFTAVAKPALAHSGPNVAALAYDAQTDFSSSWIRFDKPQSKVTFYACRDGGPGDPAHPNVNVDAYDASGTQIDNQQGIQCDLNGPLVPVTVEKPGITFIHVAGTGGSAPPGAGWAIDDLEYATDPPPYVPPPVVSPPPSPATAPLAIKGVTTAAPVVAGRATLLSAALVGQAQRLAWDVTGDGKTDVSCPGTQTTLGFRAPGAAANGARASASASAATSAISVQAYDAAGASTAFSQKFAVAAAPPTAVSSALKLVRAAYAKAPAVYTCGSAQDFASTKVELLSRKNDSAFLELLKTLGCEDRTIVSGTLNVRGCFKPIRSATQIPADELGSLKPLIGISKISYADEVAGKEAPAGTFVERALDFSDAYISSDPVLVNGVKLSPQGAGRIVYFPQVRRLFSANATLSVGGIGLDAPRSFSLNTVATNAARKVPLGTFKRLPGGLGTLAGFGLTGDVSVVLTPSNGATPAGADIRTELRLPPFLDLVPGVSANGAVSFRATASGDLLLGDLRIGPIDAAVGPVGISGLELGYTAATREWRGMGQLCFSIACIDAREIPGEAPPGGVVIRDGELQRIYANATFPGPGITLFPGVQLNRIGAGMGLNPTRLLGGARVTAAGIFEIDGALALAFPSSAAPYVLQREEVGQAFPAQLYANRYTTATMAIGADAYLKVPGLDVRVRLGGAYLLYNAPGYIAFGGGIDFDFYDIVSVAGHADGEMNFANGRFNLGAHARVCVVDIICAGADAQVSDIGVGGCVNVDIGITDVNIGGGVVFSPFHPVIWPFDGCRWTRFADLHVFGASAAQAGQPLQLKVKAGDPSLAVQLDGAGGAPRVRVTTPDGGSFESTPGAGANLTEAVRILRSEQLKTTIVGLQDPKPGTYTIEPLPGSPAITKTTEAEDPPAARITANVADAAPATAARGTAVAAASAAAGARRTLSYDIRPRPGQKVTFVEVGSGGGRVIGTAVSGRGTLTFTPAPGRGRRRIEAQFSLAGLPAETLTVARFTPPSAQLSRPAAVRVSRRGGALRVTWPRVAGATRYDVVVTAASGTQRHRRTAAASITVAGVPQSSGGVVAVRATAPERQGASRSARFRASARRAPTRFGPLPRLPRHR